LPSRVSRAGLLPLAGAIALFGAAWPVTKLAVLHGASPAWFAFGRATLSCLSAAALVAVSGQHRVPGRGDILPLLTVGLLQLAGFFALGHLAIALAPAGRTAVLSNATGVWIVPLSVLLGEAVPPWQWLAAVLGLLGVFVIVGPWGANWAQPGLVLGDALLLGAALCWALAIVVIRRRPPRMSLLEMLPWAFLLASIALLPLALVHPVGHWDATGWAALLFIGLVAGPGGTWCVLQATRHLPMVVASTGFLGAPAFGLLLASVWLGEAMTPDLLLGAALILGGVVAASLPAARRRAA
jgi:O-acetylserine/cysteine efflux transporter